MKSERLHKIQQEEFGEWYKHRSALEKLEGLRDHSSVEDARRAADKAYKNLRHSMDALISHKRKHNCHKVTTPSKVLPSVVQVFKFNILTG